MVQNTIRHLLYKYFPVAWIGHFGIRRCWHVGRHGLVGSHGARACCGREALKVPRGYPGTSWLDARVTWNHLVLTVAILEDLTAGRGVKRT